MRPFYVIGHNTNSLEEIREGLALGINAFEIDINRDAEGALYVSHYPVNALVTAGGQRVPSRMRPFFAEFRELARSPEGAGIALLILDCKVSEAAFAAEILRAAREEVTEQGTSLELIVSVPKLSDAQTFFSEIHRGLTERESLMIDEEDDPVAVSRFFAERGVRRAGYGNGIATVAGLGLPTPSLVGQIDVAVARRALDDLAFVYPWVLVQAPTMREFLRAGVSGIMVDTANSPTLFEVLREPEFASSVRMATREDDPCPIDESLVLEVVTAETALAGTDANVTFTLELDDGTSVTRTVDGAHNGRFERGSTTYVTFPAVRLAPERVRCLEVSQDGRGNAPAWQLGAVTLSRRGARSVRLEFGCEVTSQNPARRTTSFG